jgi:ABC-type Fe3+-siderophore transport system permease subunit
VNIVVATLAIVFILIGVIFLLDKRELLYIKAVDPEPPKKLGSKEKYTVGLVFLFVGSLLGASAYSLIFKNNPYWFIDGFFKLFT